MIHLKIFRTVVFLICISICSGFTLQSSNEEKAAPEMTKELRAEHVYDAKVFIGDRISYDKSKRGQGGMIPITGGTFEGPNIKGEVLPGGADWQMMRPDGDMELYARYILKTHDGYIIEVINRVLVHMDKDGEQMNDYVRSVLDFEAPLNSPYEWLNHAIFVGTLDVPSPDEVKEGEQSYVIIGVYKLL